MQIYTFTPKEGFGSNCYLVEHNGEYLVVDPSVDLEQIYSSHPEAVGKIKYVLLTHAHFDHMLSINSYAEQKIEVCIGAEDGPSLCDSYYNCYLGFYGVEDGYYGKYTALCDGDRLQLGGTDVVVKFCPGHTKGSVYYRIADSVFVGDTLFAGGGFGRTDLPGGDFSKLERSLIYIITHEKSCIFYPGHGDTTTLERAVADISNK